MTASGSRADANTRAVLSSSRAVAFAGNWSIEATRPGAADIGRLVGVLPPQTAIYLSSVPSLQPHLLAEAAGHVRAAGFEPVPHIAARRYSEPALRTFLAQLRTAAEVRRIMLIAGDEDRVIGPFPGALEVIESGLLTDAGVTSIGIAGYPEGHPHLLPDVVDTALAAKLAAAGRAGLEVQIVSQFCFDAAAIVGWVMGLRARGIVVPIRVGLAGPTSFTGLLRYAALCGVKTSARGLMRHGVPGGLAGQAGPDRLLDALLAAPQQLGDITPHFFSFGGLLKTAQYACQRAAAGDAIPT